MRRRSYLFVPANRPRMYEHAERSEADVLVVDLEDAVPVAEKAAARDTVAATFGVFAAPAARVFLRVNADGALQEADLHLAARLPLAGLVVPKVEEAADLARVADWLAARPADPQGHHPAIVALLETPRGVLAAPHITAGGHPRLAAVAFGAEDFSAVMSVDAADAATNAPLLDHARASVTIAAAAAGLPAIDSPSFAVHDVERVRQETLRARGFGFTAKFAIHPAQIAPIHEILSPGPEARAWAQRVLDAYDAAVREGRGVIEIDGRMVDLPTVRRARAILGES
ncbi:MAG: CoA ester lyase [Acidobacteriota bacterium]|nr:CoA ester lyase [Acidobacteriota bacterium]